MSMTLVIGPWTLWFDLKNDNHLVVHASVHSSKQHLSPVCELLLTPSKPTNTKSDNNNNNGPLTSSSPSSSSSSYSVISLLSLPVGILDYIASFLPDCDFLQLSSVCQQWKRVCDSEMRWKAQFIRLYGSFPLLEMSWKQRYFFLSQLRVYNKEAGYSNRNFASEHDCLSFSCGSPLMFRRWYAGMVTTIDSKEKARSELMGYLRSCCALGYTELAKMIVEQASGSLGDLLLEQTSELYSGTPLHHAARGGHLDIVDWLCELCPQMVDQRDPNGLTPLAIAIYHRHAPVAKYLIQNARASLLMPNSYCTAVVTSVYAKGTEMLALILEEVKKLPINEREELLEKDRPLEMCLERGDMKKIGMLIDAGTDVLSLDLAGHNYLIYAFSCFDIEEIDALANANALLKAVPAFRVREFVNNQGCVPLLAALHYCSPRATKWLIEKGADVNGVLTVGVSRFKATAGTTPLEEAKKLLTRRNNSARSREVIAMLIEAGAKEKRKKNTTNTC